MEKEEFVTEKLENEEFDVVGFGNSILDVTLEIDDDFLAKFNLKKGTFHLINDEESKKFHEHFKGKIIDETPGGSVSNTIAGVALLGGKATYIGGLGNDAYGEIYKKKTLELGIKDSFIKKDASTGQCLAFISNDGERTFAVNLGKCNYISPEEINYNFKTKITHLEGFKLEHEVDFHTAKKLAEYSHSIGAKVSLDVNDSGVIERLGEKMKNFLKEYVDILFMNEHEARALSGHDDENALDIMQNYCELVVLKIGKKGSLVRFNKKTYKIEPADVEKITNTNGAGDAYEAAFLYGLSKNLDIEKIGKLASVFSAHVVKEQGARVLTLAEEIKELLI